jgi:hypothetical protein
MPQTLSLIRQKYFWVCLCLSAVFHILYWIDVSFLLPFDAGIQTSVADKSEASVDLAKMERVYLFEDPHMDEVKDISNRQTLSNAATTSEPVRLAQEIKKTNTLVDLGLKHVIEVGGASHGWEGANKSNLSLPKTKVWPVSQIDQTNASSAQALVVDDALNSELGQVSPPVSAKYPYRAIFESDGKRSSLSGVLEMKVEGERYRLSLATSQFFIKRELVSSGTVGHSGLIPERYEEDSSGRKAINFQREKNLLTAKRYQADMLPNMDIQDQLSMQVQLGLLLKRALGSGRIELPVRLSMHVGLMDKLATWIMLCDRQESLGGLLLVHCSRQIENAGDVQFEAWLDPSQNWSAAGVRIIKNMGAWRLELLTSRWPEDVALPQPVVQSGVVGEKR